MNNKLIIAFALATSFGVYAAGNSISITPEMMKAAQNSLSSQGEKLVAFDLQHAEEIARKITDYSNSPDFRQKQNDLKSQVYKTAGIDGNNESEKGPELVSDQVVLFVSSSMPVQTLRNYARALAKVNGVMVLRGSVGGMS